MTASSPSPASPLDTRPTPTPEALRAGYERALGALERAQQARGAWAGEVVWNPMLICQYVIAMHVLGREIPAERRRNIRRQLEVTRKRDGGWGMHPDPPEREPKPEPAFEPGPAPVSEHDSPDAEAPAETMAGKFDSWMFHTVLGYVALRLLGDAHEPGEDPQRTAAMLEESLAWIHAHGGPERAPTWGRIWLALLGLYPWDLVQPLLPELWLLPDDAPMHPRRLYCHMRLIYLGLSYLWGARVQAPSGPVLDALAAELYPGGPSRARFEAARDDIAPTDLFEPVGAVLQWAFAAGRTLDRATDLPLLRPPLAALRRRALDRAWAHIEFEFHSTDWVCLSPVNGMLFCLAMAKRDPDHPDLDRALAGLEYWVWEDAEEGARICGARSDIWDTSFALQALAEGPELELGRALAQRAAAWLPKAQVMRELSTTAPGALPNYRSPTRGGWGFADERHPWPVSDCTAEALEALLHVEARGWIGEGQATPALSPARKLAAAEFILLRQNDDGGFGSYEERRGSMALIHFNPAEMYGNCMLEYSYAECSASCVRALAVLREREPALLASAGDLRARVDAAVDAGVRFLLEAVDPKAGAWRGFWGVNYTYGTYFAVSALLAAGVEREHLVVRRAVRFLLDRQRADGGWAEDYRGLLERDSGTLLSRTLGAKREPRRGAPSWDLADDEASRVTQTAWAVATLALAAPQRARQSVDAGLAYLLERQQADGTWEHDASVGVFFNTAVLDYRLYRQVFPTWALARCLEDHHLKGDEDCTLSKP
ncbi:squalene cyclase family protein [Plesiocystis pacifica SIR-1]|uniref:Squalene cyclase family protein n=1 Tax=Plesiocystis pacifica SIR-1 TaxID=391625 RepID=A6FWU9_9BACT|nr:prenyltransferase/squalene oxidase repeat-containing protein [Plesiocystis pacifica]EDM81773.1 squalene cyclase family protein [Plesiocystis pacifica SIR-1]